MHTRISFSFEANLHLDRMEYYWNFLFPSFPRVWSCFLVSCFLVADWCFIFVFHEEHRKYHEYPEYWVQCEILEQRYWYHFCIEWNCVEKDGTVNISWLVEIFLTICCLITARLFWNVVTKSSQRQDGHCLKWNNF